VVKTVSHAPADYRHRPERPIVSRDFLDRIQIHLRGKIEQNPWRFKFRRQRFVKRVAQFSTIYKAMPEADMLARIQLLSQALRIQGFTDHLVAETFAVIREMSGHTLGMRHFDSQLTGGWIMLQGRIAEMKTGEGKTLTAVLPVITAALAGLPVHVVTVNY